MPSRAAAYVDCQEGQARQLQHALRLWETLFRLSELYAQARADNDVAARASPLREAASVAETLLPYYEWLAGFYERMEAGTGCRIGDGRSRLPTLGAEQLRQLAGQLRAAADNPASLPEPSKLWLLDKAPPL